MYLRYYYLNFAELLEYFRLHLNTITMSVYQAIEGLLRGIVSICSADS